MGCTFSSIFKNIGNSFPTIESPQVFAVNDRRFRLVKKLGEGGYSYVYLVREVSDGQQNEYALKKVSQGLI